MMSLVHVETGFNCWAWPDCLDWLSHDWIFCSMIYGISTHTYLFSRLPLSEDPALAMAFSVARRAAAVPLLLVNGTFRKTVRSYLDSSILQHQLQRLHDHASLKGFIFWLYCIFGFFQTHVRKNIYVGFSIY